MVRGTQSGRSCLAAIVLVGILAVGAYLAWSFVHQQQAGPAVSASGASAESAHRKALAFAAAQAQAQRTGQPVRVVQSFDDAELSSLANEAAQARGLEVSQISLHATAQGTVQGRGQARVAGQDVPVSLEGVPVVAGDRVALDVKSTKVGAIPIPGSVGDRLTESLRQPLALGQPITGFQDLRVQVSEGQVTVTGVAEPA